MKERFVCYQREDGSEKGTNPISLETPCSARCMIFMSLFYYAHYRAWQMNRINKINNINRINNRLRILDIHDFISDMVLLHTKKTKQYP